MKKVLWVGMLLLGFAFAGVAADRVPEITIVDAPQASSTDSWEFFQLGFWFDYPSTQSRVPTAGFRIGAPFCGGSAPVYGIEAAVLGAGSDEVKGIQFGLCAALAKKLSGLQVSFFNDAEKVCGLQFGVINMAQDSSFQLGLVNYNENGFLPWCFLVNFNF